MKRLLLTVAAALSFATGCVSYPIVKKEAFDPGPKKVAIVVYDAEPAAGPMGMPVKVKEIAKPYGAFREKLAAQGSRFTFIDDEVLDKTPYYFKLSTVPVDMGTSAPKLRRVQLHEQEKISELAKAIAADLVIVVHSLPSVQPKTQVMGVGTSVVNVKTDLFAYDPSGQEIWRDVLNTESDSFATAGKAMDAQAVERGTLKAMNDAAAALVERLEARLRG